MRHKDLYSREDREALQDVLEDFLELRASLQGEKTGPIREFLFSKSLDGLHIFPIEGFRLGRSLVVFERREPVGIQHLVFLCPEDGKIQVFPLRSSYRKATP